MITKLYNDVYDMISITGAALRFSQNTKRRIKKPILQN